MCCYEQSAVGSRGGRSVVGTHAAVAELDAFFEPAGGASTGGLIPSQRLLLEGAEPLPFYTADGGDRGSKGVMPPQQQVGGRDAAELADAIRVALEAADLKRSGRLDGVSSIGDTLGKGLPEGTLSPYEMRLLARHQENGKCE